MKTILFLVTHLFGIIAFLVLWYVQYELLKTYVTHEMILIGGTFVVSLIASLLIEVYLYTIIEKRK